jgi:hypothetical protein
MSLASLANRALVGLGPNHWLISIQKTRGNTKILRVLIIRQWARLNGALKKRLTGIRHGTFRGRRRLSEAQSKITMICD